MQRESLATVLREARSDWSARDLAAVQLKLVKVGIGTSEDLAKALQNQLNERLREAGLKAFSNETVQALKRCLDVEPLTSMQDQEGDLGALVEAETRLVPEEPLAEAYGQPLARAAAPWAETEEPLTHVQPEPSTGDRAGRGDFGGTPPSETPGSGGAPVPEEASGDVRDVMALAKGQGISMEKLVQPSKAEALLRQLDGLESMTLPELQAMYEEHGCPADRRMRKKELVAGLRNIFVWEQLVVSALQEVCEREGLAVKKTQPRAELVRVLRDAKWEALGIPIQRLPSFEAARCLLEQVQDLEGLDPQQLAAQCHSWGLPVVPLEFRQNPSAERSPEYMAAQLKQAFVWKEMPASELRRDCRAFGVALDDLDSSAPADELLERLMQSLWGNRWEGHGVPLERLKSLRAAEELLKQMERLQPMGTLSLQVECNRLSIPFNTQMEDALLEERLKDTLIWRQLPPAELQRDCKLLDIAPAGARESLPARLLRRKDTLREWEAQGIPVSRFGGDYHKALELHKEYKSITLMSRKGLEKWYRSIGFPEEKEIEKSELEKLYKKVRFWEMLSTNELEQDCARLASATSITAKDEKEKRADLTFQLFKHERLVAWDKRGFHALRIGNADLAAQIVKQYETFQAMDDSEFRKLCGDMGLPCGLGEEREVMGGRVKRLMAWEMMPWTEVYKDCVEHGLSVQVGRTTSSDELKRAEWIQQLSWKVFWDVPVGRLGAAKASNLAGHYQGFDSMSDAELAEEYSRRLELPAVPHMERSELVATLRQWTLWLQLPITELWSECRERGVLLDYFCLPKPVQLSAATPSAAAPPAEEALRVQLLPRLFLRDKVVLEEAKREELPTGYTADRRHSPGSVEGQEDHSGKTVDAKELPEVWRYVELIRDPVMCQHVCGVKRREPPPPDVRLPAAASTWPPLEAALYVLTGGNFHPRRHGRDGEPPALEAADPDAPLVSVVCPTCERRQHFHRQLYACFQAQDYERKELVVVDTGARPSAFLEAVAREDPRVVYRFFDVDDLREGLTVRAGKFSWSLGLKRNVACCLARGEAIAHFDDDDVYAPHYLTAMVPRLLRASRSSGDIPVSGLAPAAAKLSAWHLLDLSTMAFHHLDVVTDPSIPLADQRGWIYGWGFSYTFTRTAWELAPVPDVEFAEDLGFIEGLILRHIPIALVGQVPHRDGLVAHTFHMGSTSGGERLVAAVGTPVARPNSFGAILSKIQLAQFEAEKEGF